MTDMAFLEFSRTYLLEKRCARARASNTLDPTRVPLAGLGETPESADPLFRFVLDMWAM